MPLKDLSTIEISVLKLISEANTVSAISQKLSLPIAEVENIEHEIYRKLGVRNCFQAALKYSSENEES